MVFALIVYDSLEQNQLFTVKKIYMKEFMRIEEIKVEKWKKKFN